MPETHSMSQAYFFMAIVALIENTMSCIKFSN